MSQNQYSSLLGGQYNLITAENECKWTATEPNRAQFSYDQCDRVLQFARTNSQTFRGHNLCWGEYNPGWLTNGQFTPDTKRSILENHIRNVMSHYGNNAYCWDVVNEAVSDTSGVQFKNNVWYPDIPDYVDFAFKTARSVNPTMKLFYNDYNIASATGWSQDKSQRVYDMIKSMKTRGIPIDGIGFQLHVNLDYDSMISGVRQNIQRYADLGLEVHFTELDIRCSQDNCQWTPDKEQTQAKIYADLLQVCLDFPNTCKNFETWGFTDKYTWLSTNQHPLPFDENYNPKPAFESLLTTMQK